jgi:hypothetical protein
MKRRLSTLILLSILSCATLGPKTAKLTSNETRVIYFKPGTLEVENGSELKILRNGFWPTRLLYV